MLSRLQLETEMLERLGQGRAAVAKPAEPPDFVFYTGCNVLKTPHIALLALDIMDTLGVSYQMMGGPSHCCGVMQLRAGDVEMSGRMGSASIDKLSRGKSGQVLSWCPSCYVQFTETTLPTLEQQQGARPFEMTPFLRFLRGRLGDLQPHMREPVELRVALHKHPGVAGVVEAAAEILRGRARRDAGRSRAAGGRAAEHQSRRCCPPTAASWSCGSWRRRAMRASMRWSRSTTPITARLCAHERDWPFRIVNLLEIVGQSMGLHQHDRFKELKMLQDADLIVAECRDLIAQHALDAAVARDVIAKAMFAEQPVPLGTGPGRAQAQRA